MSWASQNVPQGGMLHPAKAQYRPETYQFLKVPSKGKEESKLTMMQRNKINYALKNGEPLPSLSRRRKGLLKIPGITIRPGSPIDP
ncbi:unnamed protein product [Ceutorhynchus assimilis]|uniref:Uncharacterized protein n=1 Tax=Ceutorhynchus assimilis TaxID=467358 RepID=A0A9N9QD06_9CUCU|nr:unnamed protein product [Ceutorhynchus assimilis]